MKFYIASSLKNYEQVQCLARILKSAGWTHTYDWTVHGSVKATNSETLKAIGIKEFDGVKSADIVIVLTPQGRGTHTEFGMAIALNKQIYLCHSDDTYFKCDENTSSFYWLPQVKRITGSTDDIAMEILKSNQRKKTGR
jgi:nucleoside 2-deoxyribosyltransferase